MWVASPALRGAVDSPWGGLTRSAAARSAAPGPASEGRWAPGRSLLAPAAAAPHASAAAGRLRVRRAPRLLPGLLPAAVPSPADWKSMRPFATFGARGAPPQGGPPARPARCVSSGAAHRAKPPRACARRRGSHVSSSAVADALSLPSFRLAAARRAGPTAPPVSSGTDVLHLRRFCFGVRPGSTALQMAGARALTQAATAERSTGRTWRPNASAWSAFGRP